MFVLFSEDQSSYEDHLASYARGPGTLPGVKRPGPEFDHFCLAPRISTTEAIFILHIACEGANFLFLYISSLVYIL